MFGSKINASVRTPSISQTQNTAQAPASAPQASKPVVAAGQAELRSRSLLNDLKPGKGIKLAAKVGAGAIGGGGLLAFAGYGIYSAAPHIGALFGLIATSHATLPILATVGAVLGAVALAIIIRKAYQNRQQKKLVEANNDAAKREAAAFATANAATVMPQAEIKQTESEVAPSVNEGPESAPSLRSSASQDSLEAEVLKTRDALASMSLADRVKYLTEAQSNSEEWDKYFEKNETAEERAGNASPERLDELARLHRAADKCAAVLQIASTAHVAAVGA